MKKSHFLGIDFSVGTQSSILKQLREIVDTPGRCSTIVMHGNLNTVYNSARFTTLNSALNHSRALVIFEGIGLKIAKFLTSLDCWPDISGTELVPTFLSKYEGHTLRLALVGGDTDVANTAALAIAHRYPNVLIVQTLNGFSDLSDERAAFDSIALARPDILLLGLGTPIQEIKAHSFAEATNTPLIWCVGGLFDLLAGVKQRAPRWILFCRIEWLWRLIRHPRTYWQRTFIHGPWLLLQVCSIWKKSR